MTEFVFTMPDIGEGIVEAEVVAWHVVPGDILVEDAPLADVMTDKATVEITSPVSGRVESLGCEAGDKMVIGAAFVVFALDGEKDPETDASEAVPTISPPLPTNKKPKIRVVTDGSVTASANSEVPPIEEVAQLNSSQDLDPVENSQASPGQPIDDSVTNDNCSVVDWSDHHRPHESGTSNRPVHGSVLASPAVRKYARDRNLDLSKIKGSGLDGRILKSDLFSIAVAGQSGRGAKKDTIKQPPKQQMTDSRTSLEGATKELERHLKSVQTTGVADEVESISTDQATSADPQVIPILGMRRLIAERMLASKQNIPHFSYVEEVCIDELETLRQHLNVHKREDQPKLSLLHFILQAVAKTVEGWPQCNAHFDDHESALLQFESVHIGVATMTDAGLLVPVVRDVAALDVWQIAKEVNRLAISARDGKLSRDQLTGSTITVTSLGALAGVSTTPVINRPETTIIGPNKMWDKLVLRDGLPVNSRVMNISSSFDHRVVDGYDAASMIQALKAMLEKPALLYLD